MINLESFNPIVSRIEETTEKFIHCLSSELQIVEYIRAAVDFFTGQTGSLDTIGSFLSDAENGKIFILWVWNLSRYSSRLTITTDIVHGS